MFRDSTDSRRHIFTHLTGKDASSRDKELLTKVDEFVVDNTAVAGESEFLCLLCPKSQPDHFNSVRRHFMMVHLRMPAVNRA